MGLGAVVGGVIGGLVGACVWAGVEFTTGYQVGWIAWGIGALAGIGVQLGGRGAGGAAGGLTAAGAAIVSVLVAKAMVSTLISRHIGPEHLAIAEIANEVTLRYVVEGYEVQVDESARTPVEYYPAEIWADAERAWNRLQPDQREALMREMAAMGSEFNRRQLLKSFSPYDILWFLLAMATAFKLGSAASTGIEERPINFEEIPEGEGLPAQLRAEERKETAARQIKQTPEQEQPQGRQRRDQGRTEGLTADSLTGILGVAGGDGKTAPRRRRGGAA